MRKHNRPKLVSVIIPVFRSSESLGEMAEQFADLRHALDYAIEIIFVNDSPGHESTAQALKQILKMHQDVTVVTLRKNQGQHIALLVGMQQAQGELVITMDDDLQHPVSAVPHLVEELCKKPEIDGAFAVPGYMNRKHPVWRSMASYALNKTDSLFLNKPRGLQKSAFRIMRSDICKSILRNRNAMPSVSALLVQSTHRLMNIKVEHHARAFGKSQYTIKKLISLMLNNILHYSSLPLRVVGIMGLCGSVISILFITSVLLRKWFWGIGVPGYASTVTLISFFGGMQLFATGLIGEYLIRILKEQQKWDIQDYIAELSKNHT